MSKGQEIDNFSVQHRNILRETIENGGIVIAGGLNHHYDAHLVAKGILQASKLIRNDGRKITGAIYLGGQGLHLGDGPAPTDKGPMSRPDQSTRPHSDYAAMLENAFRIIKELVKTAPPIILDIDDGFANETLKLFIESTCQYASAYQIEDQKFQPKDPKNHILVPMNDLIFRINTIKQIAAKNGYKPVIMARTNALHATHLTDTDISDTEFLDGKLKDNDGYILKKDEATRLKHLSKRLKVLNEQGVDVVWIDSPFSPTKTLAMLKEVHNEYPNLKLVYNYPPTTEWNKVFSTSAEIQAFEKQLTDCGVCIHFSTRPFLTLKAMVFEQVAKAILEEGIAPTMDKYMSGIKSLDTTKEPQLRSHL